MTSLLLLAFTVGISGNDKAVDSQSQQSLTRFVSQVSQSELRLVERLQGLRKSVERLPETWQAKGLKSLSVGEVLTKKKLIAHIEEMELTAAERWALILENSASMFIEQDKADVRIQALRKELSVLPKAHADFNQKIDRYNAQLKDAILINMADKFVNN